MELQGIVKGFSKLICIYLNKNYSQIYTAGRIGESWDAGVARRGGGRGAAWKKGGIFRSFLGDICIVSSIIIGYNTQVGQFLENCPKNITKEVKQ
jgi:hypothetical protein